MKRFTSEGTNESVGPNAVIEDSQLSRVALVSGRPTYWLTPKTAQPGQADLDSRIERIGKLCEWCLKIPDVRLGLNPSDIGFVVRSTPEKLGENSLAERVQQAKTSDGYVWFKSEEVEWWSKAIIDSMEDCAQRAHHSDFWDVFRQHRFILFAPSDGSELLENLRNVPDDLLSADFRQRISDDYPNLTHLVHEYRDTVYWSWQLINLRPTSQGFINMPLLALWSDWPTSERWAPQEPEPYRKTTPLTPNQAASFLEDVLYTQFERLFRQLRSIFSGVPEARPDFSGRESRPPLFYFAHPVRLPASAEDYAKNMKEAIHPFVRRCLACDDPLADTVSWGILEGDLVVLRREQPSSDFYAAWYLLLPTESQPVSTQEVEVDLGIVVDQLAYLEFSIGEEAQDVWKQMEPINERMALWGATLDEVNDLAADAIDFMPTLGSRDLDEVQEDFAHLNTLVHRLKAQIERTSSKAKETQNNYVSYLDSTDDYFRRGWTFSSLPSVRVAGLRSALQGAYPYQYLKQGLQTVQTQADFLPTSAERIAALLNTALETTDRQARERLERWTRGLGALIGILALLVALPQFIPDAQLKSSTYPNLLDAFISLDKLAADVRFMVGLAIIGLIIFLVAMLINLILHLLPNPQDRFSEQVRQFRVLVNNAVTKARTTKELERMDREATDLLDTLWSEFEGDQKQTTVDETVGLNRFRRLFRSAQVDNWRPRSRSLRYRIQLFDFRPENVPLPRTLCILRYKSEEIYSNSIVSDEQFRASLRPLGLSEQRIRELDELLQQKQGELRGLSVSEYAKKLEKWAVSAERTRRQELREKLPRNERAWRA